MISVPYESLAFASRPGGQPRPPRPCSGDPAVRLHHIGRSLRPHLLRGLRQGRYALLGGLGAVLLTLVSRVLVVLRVLVGLALVIAASRLVSLGSIRDDDRLIERLCGRRW